MEVRIEAILIISDKFEKQFRHREMTSMDIAGALSKLLTRCKQKEIQKIRLNAVQFLGGKKDEKTQNFSGIGN